METKFICDALLIVNFSNLLIKISKILKCGYKLSIVSEKISLISKYNFIFLNFEIMAPKNPVASLDVVAKTRSYLKSTDLKIT